MRIEFRLLPASSATTKARLFTVAATVVNCKNDGVMAIILPHGVLFRGCVEERIRRKLLDDGHIDTVIGLPPNLFYSTEDRRGDEKPQRLPRGAGLTFTGGGWPKLGRR